MKTWQISLGVCALLLFVRTEAREATLPLSRQLPVQALANLVPITVGSTDVAAELANDRKIGVTTPLRIASPAIVDITPVTHGVWELVPGGRIWRARIFSEGATDLSLGFSRYHLPERATLHISSEDEDYTQGAFTARDNKAHGQLWTPMVPGDRLTVEMFVPAGANEPEVAISQVNCGYRDMFRRRKNPANAKAAGDCNNDVNCSIAQSWTNEIRSVAVYSIGGDRVCTGTLLNNVAGDKRNFFLTADHCDISAANAPSVVVYWNFESPACGQHGGGSLAQNQSGATLRMRKADVDVTLIELEDVPDTSFRVYYSGWDRSGIAPAGAVGIHHPDTAEKSISFSSNTLTTTDNCIDAGNNTHWSVTWSSGVTEPGSSGSGIWDPVSHKLVGTLSGGESFCVENEFEPDCYGKFSVAWNSGANSSARLKDWLDPMNTGSNSIVGLDPLLLRIPRIANATLTGNCANGIISTGETVTLSLTLTNEGAFPMTNLIVTLLPGTGVSFPSPPEVFGFLPSGTNISRSFTFVTTGSCGGFLAGATRLQLQDGPTNFGTLTNAFSLGGVFAENFDSLTPPMIPTGWTNFRTGTNALWKTIRGKGDTLPNSIYAPDPPATGDVHITSSPIPINTTNAVLSFRHKYDFEIPAGYDGGVLEIATGTGPFIDITNSGSFITNGYTSLISTNYKSPLAGRRAWSGVSGGFITTKARLPAAAAGQNVRLRWRVGTDTSNPSPVDGWYVDNIFITEGTECCSPPVAPTIIELRRLTNESVAFSFASVAGQAYHVEYKGSLSVSNWQALQTIIGDGTLKRFTNDFATSNRFFRLRSP